MKLYIPIIRPEIEYGNRAMRIIKRVNEIIIIAFGVATVAVAVWVAWTV